MAVATPEQTREDIRDRLRRRPFRSFAIEMNDRVTRFEIVRLNQAAVGLNTFAVAPASGRGVAKTLYLKDVAYVVDL
jgi:hypothetical protein